MSQLESIKRMLVIITKVRSTRKYTSQQELLNEVNDSMDIRGYKEISAKTLERDLRHIEEAFGLTIGFDARLGHYAIKDDLSNREERMEELLFNFDLLNELDSHSPLRSFVLAEHHRPPQIITRFPKLLRIIVSSGLSGSHFISELLIGCMTQAISVITVKRC